MAACVRFEFKVEKIIAISQDGSCQVQWTPSWVSRSHLVNCEHLVQELLRQQNQDIKCELESDSEETQHASSEIDGSEHHLWDLPHQQVKKDMNPNLGNETLLQPLTFPVGVTEEHSCVELDPYSTKGLEFHEQQTECDKECEPAQRIKAMDMPSEIELLEPQNQGMICEIESNLEETQHASSELDGSEHHLHDLPHQQVKKDMNPNLGNETLLQPLTFPVGVPEEHTCVELDPYSAKELEIHEQQTECDEESKPAQQINALDVPSEVDDSVSPVQEFSQPEAGLPTEVGEKSHERTYGITNNETDYQTTLQPSTYAVEVKEGRMCPGSSDHIPVSGNATQNSCFSNGSDRGYSTETGSTPLGHIRLSENECLSENSSMNSFTVKPRNVPELSHKQGDDDELLCSTNASLFTQKCGLDQGERPYTCKECGKSFTDNFTLTDHLGTHTSDKPFHCDVCTKSFAVKHTLQQHKLTHTGEKPYSCPHCTHTCNQKSNLVSHMYTHTGEKLYSCPQCTRSFSQKGGLVKHMKTHTGDRPYTCKECGKSFLEKFNLASHLRTHTGDKPFHCDMCTKSFTMKHSLQQHKLIHNGEKPYSCPHCTHACCNKSNLRTHMRTHTGEKPFTCDVCGKRYAQKNYLKIHTSRVHTGEKPFSCEVCGKKFASSSNLNQHVRIHHTKKKQVTESSHLKGQQNKEEDFSCSYCDTCFASSRDLRKHLRIHR